MQITWGNLSKYRRQIMGIACLWIMLHHQFFDWPAITKPIKIFADYGNIGVELFLLMSGIGLYYAYQSKPSLGTFYCRRFVRLWVPYLVLAIPFYVWMDLYLGHGSFLMDLTMLSFPLERVLYSWFVFACTFFYLFFPLIYFLQNEKHSVFGQELQRHTVTLFVVMADIVLCLSMSKLCPEWYNNFEIALTRLPIFVIGCDMAKSVREEKSISQGMLYGSVSYIIVNVVFRRMVSIPAIWIRFSYIPLSLAICVVFAAVLPRIKAQWIAKFLAFFGDRSLELYLSHVFIRYLYLEYFPTDLFDPWGVISYALILLAAVAVSFVLHPIIERLNKFILRNLCRHG